MTGLYRFANFLEAISMGLSPEAAVCAYAEFEAFDARWAARERCR